MEFMVNGERFGVGLVQLGRSLRKDYKYRVVTEDGVEHAEVRATYVDFSLTLGNLNAAEYERLMERLSASEEAVTITLPTRRTGDESYTGRFEGIADELITQDDTENYWDSLSLSFTGTKPVEVNSA